MSMMYSDDEDDYGYMGHGEGPSLDHYSVLPEIPSSGTPKHNDEMSTVKIREPLKVLPDIKLMPRPPTASKKKPKKTKKPRPPASVRGGTFDILPKIPRRNAATNELQTDDLMSHYEEELQFYDKLSDLEDLGIHPQHHDVLRYIRDDLECFKYEMAVEEKFETPNVSTTPSNQKRCETSANNSSTKLHRRPGKSLKALSNEKSSFYTNQMVPSPPKSSQKRLNTTSTTSGDDGSKRRRGAGRLRGDDNVLSHPKEL